MEQSELPERVVESKTNPEITGKQLEVKTSLAAQERDRLIAIFSGNEEKKRIIGSLPRKDYFRIATNKNSPTYIFEVLAKQEYIQKETDKQRVVRETMESVFESQQLTVIFSPDYTGMPDGVTINFDGLGNLIIEKIIEAKISVEAATQKRKLRQPERTFATINNIVSAINKISSSNHITPQELFPDKELSQKTQNRISEMIELIHGLGLKNGEKITFSSNLTYETIIPKSNQHDEDRKREQVRNIDNTNIQIFVSECIFSKEDLDKITQGNTV